MSALLPAERQIGAVDLKDQAGPGNALVFVAHGLRDGEEVARAERLAAALGARHVRLREHGFERFDGLRFDAVHAIGNLFAIVSQQILCVRCSRMA